MNLQSTVQNAEVLLFDDNEFSGIQPQSLFSFFIPLLVQHQVVTKNSDIPIFNTIRPRIFQPMNP